MKLEDSFKEYLCICISTCPKTTENCTSLLAYFPGVM